MDLRPRPAGHPNPSGRILLDTPDPGQQAFQALLFDCFFSRVSEHPSDRSTGRSFSFADLLTYFSSLSPRHDRLIIRTNTAARVARHLMPAIRTWADGGLHSAFMTRAYLWWAGGWGHDTN